MSDYRMSPSDKVQGILLSLFGLVCCPSLFIFLMVEGMQGAPLILCGILTAYNAYQALDAVRLVHKHW